jgi:hypothetical protein
VTLNDTLDLLSRLRLKSKNESGSIAIISGDSGVGKSYAAETFLKPHKQKGSFILTARPKPEIDKPLYPLYEALADHLRNNQWRHQRLRKLFKEYAVMLPRIGNLIRPLIREDSYLRGIEATVAPDLLELSPYPHCLDFIKKIADGSPVILWIDDVQWADRETLNFIMYMRDRIIEEKFLLLLCLNQRSPGIKSRESLENSLSYLRASEGTATHTCDLQPYPPEEISNLIESILRRDVALDDSSLQVLYQRSRGVPFILKVFLDILREEGKLFVDAGTWRLHFPLSDLSLPASLRRGIELKLSSLYGSIPESRVILEAASVIGERFDDATIDATLSLCSTYNLLLSIEQRYSVVHHIVAERTWEFEHVTLRDFIYQSLGRRATALHLKLAEQLLVLGSENWSQIAYHFKLAGKYEEFLKFQLRQGEEFLRQGFFVEAKGIFEELWSDPIFRNTSEFQERSTEIKLKRALARFHLSEYEVCLHLLNDDHSSSEQLSPPEKLLRAKCLNKTGLRENFKEAHSDLTSLAISEEVQRDPLLLSQVYSELMVAAARLNEFDLARDAFERADLLLSRLNAQIDRARLMRKSFIFYDSDLAERLLTHALYIFESNNVDHEIVMTLNNLAAIYLDCDRPTKASDLLLKAMAKSAKIENFGMDYLLNNMSIVRLLLGDGRAALEGFREAVNFSKRTVTKLVLVNNQAAALLVLSQTRAATDSLEVLLREALPTGEDVYIVGIRFNLTLAYLVAGSFRKALFELALCNISRLKKLGGYYDRKMKELIRLSMTMIGGIKNQEACAQTITAQDVHVIDLEFWGD